MTLLNNVKIHRIGRVVSVVSRLFAVGISAATGNFNGAVHSTFAVRCTGCGNALRWMCKNAENIILPTSYELSRKCAQSGVSDRSLGFEDEELVGRYCSYLLPKQAGGNTKILVFKTLRMIGRPVL